VLSGTALDRLLAWFDADPQAAGQQYRQAYDKLTHFFQWRGSRTPEEDADDVMDRVARQLEEGRDLPDRGSPAYLYGVALNVWREQRRKPAPDSLEDGGLAQILSVDPELQARKEAERMREERLIVCLETCTRRLPPESQRLVADYHGTESNKRRRKQLAEALGIGVELLRTRMYRIRLLLERCVRTCMERQAP
jgi:DNA-directed RNA polymerase specialized sigma24 family protein